jgi:hypothetical protein
MPMKILTKTERVLIIQKGTKAGFLLGTAFVMLWVLSLVAYILFLISVELGIGWWAAIFLPLCAWVSWLALNRFLSNERMVTIYRLDKANNQFTLELQGLNTSKLYTLPLHEIRAAEVKLLSSQSVGYGYTHIVFELYLLINSGAPLAIDSGVGMGEKRELDAIASYLRQFIFDRRAEQSLFNN